MEMDSGWTHAIGNVPRRAAARWGRRKALFFNRQAWSFDELGWHADRMAAALARRVSSGDRVAILMENRPEYFFAYFAIPASGGITVPVNLFLAPAEMRAVLRDSGASVALVSAEVAGRAREALQNLPDLKHVLVAPSPGKPAVPGRGASPPAWTSLPEAMEEAVRDAPPAPAGEEAAERTAVLAYTSGTTGRPKGVMLSHRNLLTNARACIEAVGVTPRDRVLLFLPMFHSFTSMVAVLTPMVAGMSVVLCEKVDRAEIKQAIRRRRPTIVPGVPAVFTAMAQARVGAVARWLNPARLYISGGAPLSLDTLAEFERRFRRPLCEGYGLSEASPVVSINPPRGPRRPGSVGRPLPGVHVTLRDPEGREVPSGETGELCVQGGSVMQGYFRLPEETAAALRGGVLHSGDLARADADGYLHIVGRLKDMLIYRGMNVYPREIETVLEDHPDVKEAAVVGLPDGSRGEVPVAFVVPHAGRRVSESELRRACLARLARYKVPRSFRVVSDLPRNATGKVLKARLREQAVIGGASA
jgi:long-chain acyl-CoA synthetase